MGANGTLHVGDDESVTVAELERRANAVWTGLPDDLEARWWERFGTGTVDQLVAPVAGGRLELRRTRRLRSIGHPIS